MADGSLLVPRTAENVQKNCRIKIYPDGTVGEILACSMAKFTPPGWERVDKVFRGNSCGCGDEDSTERSRRRARQHVNDLIRCNGDMDVFFTLTLSDGWLYGGQAQTRTDYKAINRKVQQWFADRVRRHGLRYVAVYEYHKRTEKDGKQAIHVHGVCNHDALKMVDSGHQYKDKAGHWHHIYNIPNWSIGNTTAMYMYGDRGRATAYICKYIYKSEKPVGGRWYMHSHNLTEPKFEYIDIDFNTAPGKSIFVPESRCSWKYILPCYLSELHCE